jgi:dTDP-glucose 4,6-dehydratase
MFRKECDKDVIKTRKDDTKPMRNLLVTGGCGFIGANFVNHFTATHPNVRLINLDCLDYCANPRSVAEAAARPNYVFVRGDIANTDLVMHIFNEYEIDTLVNFAAQSHVDNSFGNSLTFTRTNVLGTHNLLECARVYGKIQKFIHVSTDEVYGEVSSSQLEHAMLNPTNPYAATKAAAEFIVKSYLISFGLPVLITRGNNVYGRFQYPEKVIPRFIMLLSQGKKLTIQGTGNSSRTFIHASDVARAFEAIVDRGVIGEIYNIGCRDELSVMEVARRVVLEIKGPAAKLEDHVTFVPDRDFNDLRYDIDSNKLIALGWKQQVAFDEGFKDTVEWYLARLGEGFWPSLKQEISTSAVDFPRAAAGV